MNIKWNLIAVCFLLIFTLDSLAAKPALILLTPYKTDMLINGWLMSEKLDGIRAYWDGKNLYSRQGNRLQAPTWFTENLPDFELDGELWAGRGQFAKTTSIVSRDEPHAGWHDISYNIFEVPNAAGGLLQRLQKIEHYLSSHRLEHVRVIPQIICLDKQHLQRQLKKIELSGGEGLVLRNPASPYETGRSLNAIKVKTFDDMDALVIGYRPGKGKYLGKTGALQVEIYDNRRFYIGSGLSDKHRQSPPPIGSIITFKYQGFTVNKIPRFATFIGVRKLP